jgi:3'(2'), 5'-bisphosphate nucleotidase
VIVRRYPPAEDLTLAVDLADQAGRLLLQARADSFAAGASSQEVGRRGDLSSNEMILAALAAQRPDDAVLSEESADDLARLDAARVWIIDPLDGTREYTMEGRTEWPPSPFPPSEGSSAPAMRW